MGTTYVLLHGSPGNAAGWEPLRAHAPANVRIEAWDLLDHGANHAPTASLDDTVADVAARVRALAGPVVLVGHSFGAWVGARATSSLADVVERFVAIDGLPRMSAEIATRSGGFAAALESGQLPVAVAAGAAIDLWLPTTNRSEEDAARIRELVTSDSVERLVRILRRQCGIAEPTNAVTHIPVATTAIHCTSDRAVALELGRELAGASAQGELVELDGDGHFPHWTDAARVAAHVFR